MRREEREERAHNSVRATYIFARAHPAAHGRVMVLSARFGLRLPAGVQI